MIINMSSKSKKQIKEIDSDIENIKKLDEIKEDTKKCGYCKTAKKSDTCIYCPDCRFNICSECGSKHFKKCSCKKQKITQKISKDDEINELYRKKTKLYIWCDKDESWDYKGIGKSIVSHNVTKNEITFLFRPINMTNYVTNHIICADTKFKSIEDTDDSLTWFSQTANRKICVYALKFKNKQKKKEFRKMMYSAIEEYY